MQFFLQCVHLFELLISHKKIFLLFYFKGGSKRGPNFTYLKGILYRIYIFYPILMCVFVVEWIVLGASGSVLTNYLYLLPFPR